MSAAAATRARKVLEAEVCKAFQGNQLIPREVAIRNGLAAGMGLRKLEALCKKASQGRGLMDKLSERVSIEFLESGDLGWWATEWAEGCVKRFDEKTCSKFSGPNRKSLEPLPKALLLAAWWPGENVRGWEASAKLCLAHGAWACDQVKKAWPLMMEATDEYAKLRGFYEGKAAWASVKTALGVWEILGVDQELTSMACDRAESACAKGRALGEWKRAACHAIGEDSTSVLQAVLNGSAQAGVDIDVDAPSGWWMADGESEENGWSLLATAAKAKTFDCFKVLMAGGARSAWISSEGSVCGVADVLKNLAARAASKPEMRDLFLSFSILAAGNLRALGMSADLAASAVENAGSKAFPKGGSARARSVREEIILRQAMALASDAHGVKACPAGASAAEKSATRRAPRL